MQMVAASLPECKWFVGKVSHMTVLKLAFLIGGPAIIVEIPRALAGEGNRVAVGFTQETFKTWQAFLQLSRIPELPPKGGWKKCES